MAPPSGIKKGTKLARQYAHVKASERSSGRSEDVAEEIAARTVNKQKAREGKAENPSSASVRDISSGRRGGLRGSGRRKERGRTRDQLYEEAKHRGIRGRSLMSKEQLERAVDTA